MNNPTAIHGNFFQTCEQLDKIEAIDFFVAERISKELEQSNSLSSEQHALLFHLLIALSDSQRNGHSCLDLHAIAEQTLFATEKVEKKAELYQVEQVLKPGVLFPSFAELITLLEPLALNASNKNSPIIVDKERLYLRRYWQFEIELAAYIQHKTAQTQTLLPAQCQKILAALFPLSDDDVDWQLTAVANALNKTFSIIAGGPGTGKTYTVTKLLAGLIMQNPDANIAMVAPTGKAAQRLSESIVGAVTQFKQQGQIPADVLDAIPSQASTIHRLLGVIRNSPNFRHDRENKLASDIVLIDEVSMVDLPMMARLFRALPDTCNVVLLGDADQLPSVATGSVLADLAPNKTTQYSELNRDFINQSTGQSLPTFTEDHGIDYLTYLTKSRRFDGEGGIGRIARFVIDGEYVASWQLLTEQANTELTYVKTSNANDYIKNLTRTYYKPIFNARTVEQAFEKLNHFRILAPTRKGELGLENINVMVEDCLRKLGSISGKTELYPGRPIMISQNHYGVNLFNGDIGLLWKNEQGRLMAYFPEADGYRQVSISRLPAFETVFAMTIHKTQGSEFNKISLMLPDQGSSRLLSRELIYTGITRAKNHIEIFCNKHTWFNGVEQKVSRASGLTERLIP